MWRAELTNMGAMSGLKLVDIRGQRSLLNYHVGGVSLKGTADAAVVPSAVDEVATSSQLRVIIDW